MKKIIVCAAMAVAIGVGFSSTESFAKGKMFEKVDTNGDGVISKTEMLSKAEERFAKMDTNGDGSVSKEEAKQHRSMIKNKRKNKNDSES